MRWGDSEVVQASCEVDGLGERRVTAGAAHLWQQQRRVGEHAGLMEAPNCNENDLETPRMAVSSTCMSTCCTLEIHILGPESVE